MNNLLRTKGILLRRTNYGEADRIVNFMTPEGKVSAIMRGARREKSKLAGSVELFAISDITLRRGKGDLDVLTSARLDKFYSNIMKDYDRLQFGYELIKKIAEVGDVGDYSDWFDVMIEVYRGLDDFAVPLQLAQTWFYIRYADLTGYQLNLERDVAGNKLLIDETYMYDVNEQGLRLSQQGSINADHIKYLRLVSAKPLMNVAQIGGVETILDDCWLLARQHVAI